MAVRHKPNLFQFGKRPSRASRPLGLLYIDFEDISRKGAELGHMLLLNINWKVCMGSPLVQLHLSLVTKITLISKAYVS